MFRGIIAALFIFSLFFCVSPRLWAAEDADKAAAQERDMAQEKALQAVEFLAGFSQGKLTHDQGNYRSIPLMVDLDFNLKPLVKKIGLNLPSLLQFVVEPFISPVFEPNGNVEVGTSFLFKVGLVPDTWKFQPYIKAGTGMLYMSQHTQEQSTQFNFIEYGGLGAHYYITKNTAFTLEGRFRHLSNASIDSPNHGINSYFVLTGVSYSF